MGYPARPGPLLPVRPNATELLERMSAAAGLCLRQGATRGKHGQEDLASAFRVASSLKLPCCSQSHYV